MEDKKIPQGWDAICKWCECLFTFNNARSVDTKNWKNYCSPNCERHIPISEFQRRRNRLITVEILSTPILEHV